jgi:hypothetical protein
MLEVGVFHKIIDRRILVEPLGVLPGPESVVEPTSVIRCELSSHVSELPGSLIDETDLMPLALGTG